MQKEKHYYNEKHNQSKLIFPKIYLLPIDPSEFSLITCLTTKVNSNGYNY